MDRDELQKAQDALKEIKTQRADLNQVSSIYPKFEQAKSAQQPLEVRQSPEEIKQTQREQNWGWSPKYTDPEHLKGTKMAETEYSSPKFNEAAEGVVTDTTQDKRASDMIGSEKPSMDLKSNDPEIRKAVDGEQFAAKLASDNEGARDDKLEDAKKAAEELTKQAKELESRKKDGPNISPSKGL